MWALAGSDTEFIHLFQLPYVLIVCIPVTWLMVQGDLNSHITVTCTLLGSAAVVAVVYQGPTCCSLPSWKWVHAHSALWHRAEAAFLGLCKPSPLYLTLCHPGDPEPNGSCHRDRF